MKEILDLKDDPYLKVLRPLVEAYKAIFDLGGRHIRSLGLTPPQFDVIAELGGTNGMTAVELSQSTLLAKASLTGIVDRLEGKGIVTRQPIPGDRRAQKICLTKKGEAIYHRSFPQQARFVRLYFERAVSKREIDVLQDLLVRLRDSCRSDHDANGERRGKKRVVKNGAKQGRKKFGKKED